MNTTVSSQCYTVTAFMLEVLHLFLVEVLYSINGYCMYLSGLKCYIDQSYFCTCVLQHVQRETESLSVSCLVSIKKNVKTIHYKSKLTVLFQLLPEMFGLFDGQRRFLECKLQIMKSVGPVWTPVIEIVYVVHQLFYLPHFWNILE